MNWTELITSEIESVYKATQGLLDHVDEESLDWKPSDGSNWMTTGQLLMHLAISCGAPMYGYVTGEWGLPEGVDINDFFQVREAIGLSEEETLPPAEKMPTIGSVSEAKEFLAEDKQLALDMVANCDEDKLANQPSKAPWEEREQILGHRLLHMVPHLSHHKAQLFYYLKLQGKPVNTSHLVAM